MVEKYFADNRGLYNGNDYNDGNGGDDYSDDDDNDDEDGDGSSGGDPIMMRNVHHWQSGLLYNIDKDTYFMLFNVTYKD